MIDMIGYYTLAQFFGVQIVADSSDIPGCYEKTSHFDEMSGEVFETSQSYSLKYMEKTR